MTEIIQPPPGGPPTARASRVVAWLCYFLLGAGMLASWNALISAADYFEALYPGRHMDRLITVCYLPPCLVFLLLTMTLSSWTHVRVVAAFAGFACSLVIIPVMDLAVIGPDSVPPEGLYGAVLAVAVAVGVFDGIGQGALYGDASLLPPEYTHAVVGGTASAGTLICIVRVVTKAAAPETVEGLRRASVAYFFVAAGVAAVCAAVYQWVVPRLAVVKYHHRAKIAHDMAALIEAPPGKVASPLPAVSEHRSLQGSATAPGAAPGATAGADIVASPAAPSSGALSPRSATRSLSLTRSLSIELPDLARRLSEPLAPPYVPPPTVAGMWARRWRLLVAMFAIYVVTLSLFPGFLAEDVKNAALGSWYPVILFLIFNVMDMISKLFPHFSLAPSQTTLMIWCLARVVFVPAFLCGSKFGAPAAVMYVLTALLGGSNGYLTALCFAAAPRGLTAIEGDLAANLMVVALVLGLNVGAYSGWLWLLGHH